MLNRRHSFSAISRPTLPLPSWKGWIFSNSAWKAMMSCIVTSPFAL